MNRLFFNCDLKLYHRAFYVKFLSLKRLLTTSSKSRDYWKSWVCPTNFTTPFPVF